MAVVIGGRIVNLPQENLSGIGSGLGQILQAIGTQRQQNQDSQILTDLSRTLQGDTLPEGIAGPERPGISDPRNRLNEILNIVPQLRRPGNQALALNLATTAERAIPNVTRAGSSRFGVTMDNALRSIGKDPLTDTITRSDFIKANEFRQQQTLQQASNIERIKVGAESDAQQALPLSQTNTALFRTLVDAETGGPVATNITGKEFTDNPQRFVSVTEAQRRDLAKINQAVNLTQQLSDLATTIFPEDEGRVRGATRRTIASLAQTDPNVVEFDRLRNASAGPLARALGEVGNLAEQEQQRALSIIGKKTDDPEVARRLALLSQQLVLDMRDVILRGGSVRNVVDDAVREGEKILGTESTNTGGTSTRPVRRSRNTSEEVTRILNLGQ